MVGKRGGERVGNFLAHFVCQTNGFLIAPEAIGVGWLKGRRGVLGVRGGGEGGAKHTHTHPKSGERERGF